MAEEEQEQGEEGIKDGCSMSEPSSAAAVASICRKEKRKASKKEKRKQKRKEAAEKERQEEEARLNDPEEQLRLQLEEERERERVERERREFEERERLFLEALARKKAQEEEEEEQRRIMTEEELKLKENQVGLETEANGEDEWEYIEDGLPEIIWQGNEIIVKKNKVKMKKKDAEQKWEEDPDRPTSNPLPPQSEAFADFKSSSTVSAQQLLENVAQQIPNFGTEQDKAHCPFHLKTGACRFGSRCSRVHFYPEISCTLLIKNMYNGPGLAWEHDEGLEYTEEEVERSYEEFYEDVHTEFLKFGEIVNFKVCRNGSYHLRGNAYVHYRELDSAVLARRFINGRYFAGKQVNCEFVGVTRWKVAICGEYMKSKLKTCSRGTACNFIHCFRNPGGDYEWADWEKPPPKYWVKRMAALFGYSHESGYDKWVEQETKGQRRNSSKSLIADEERYRSQRSLSREIKSSNCSPRDNYKEDKFRSKYSKRYRSDDTKRLEVPDEREYEEERQSRSHQRGKRRQYEREFDRAWLDEEKDADGYYYSTRNTRESSRSPFRRRSQSHDCLEIDKRKIPEKISRKNHALSGTANDSDCNKEASACTDSGRDFSHENKDCISSRDLLYRRGASDSDSAGDWSDWIIESRRVQTRKSSARVDEAAGFSSDLQESGKSLHDKYDENGSEHAKPNLHRGWRRTSSCKRKTRGDDYSDEDEDSDTRGHREIDKDDTREHHRHNHSSRKTRKADYADENIDERGHWETEKVDSREHHKHNRSGRKTSKADYADKHDEDIDKRGCWEPEMVDAREYHKHNHSSRKTRKCDYAGEHHEDIDKGGHWEPEKLDTREHHEHRRKFHGRSGSHDQNVDKHSRKSRSSNQKRKSYSRERD
ncbi:zinc finger CCCH domain-containing protein 5 [Coffea eugenioides]|uniref:zinc finger CCCH domain-containing protein 5 n=1 Tax=Coffea eugenioides TaxID=49369 RepID=UPI000F6059AF|nr:zinc finger CCCH domain-containing protein 5 [Coffea eugenioides]